MKKLFFTTVFLGMLVALLGQESQRGDNTIIIKTNESYEVAFRKMGQLLIANGFTIENVDRDFGSISTREMRIGNTFDPLWEVRISAVISGNEEATIILTAMCKGPEDSWIRLEKRGIMHMMGKGWNKLVDLANKYEGGQIEFERRD
jgi:hypothetical protein